MKTTETKRNSSRRTSLAKSENYDTYFHAYEEKDILDTDEDRIMKYYNSMLSRRRPSLLTSTRRGNALKKSWTKR